MPTGYPRFVRHRLIQQMVDLLLADQAENHCGYLFARKQDCEEVIHRYRLESSNLIQGDCWTLLTCPGMQGKCQGGRLLSTHRLWDFIEAGRGVPMGTRTDRRPSVPETDRAES